MSGQIDVLAVLDEFVVVVGDEFGNDPAVRLREARLAVAEMTRFVQDCADGRPEAEPSECRKRAIDLLARIGGSK